MYAHNRPAASGHPTRSHRARRDRSAREGARATLAPTVERPTELVMAHSTIRVECDDAGTILKVYHADGTVDYAGPTTDRTVENLVELAEEVRFHA